MKVNKENMGQIYAIPEKVNKSIDLKYQFKKLQRLLAVIFVSF